MSTGPTEPRRADDRLVLAVVCATAFAVVLNGTMLPVALPEIAGYSDAFLALVVPLLVLLAISPTLRGVGGRPWR